MTYRPGQFKAPEATWVEVAFMVRMHAGNNYDILIEKLFQERWQAEAFRDSCTELQDAKVVSLYERI